MVHGYGADSHRSLACKTLLYLLWLTALNEWLGMDMGYV